MTDFYSECETGLIALLQTKLPTFFPQPWQVSDDDASIMQGGDYFVVVRPGMFPLVRQTEQLSVVGWTVVTDLYVRYTDYKSAWTKFKAYRSAIFNLLMTYPTLSDTAGVIRVDMSSDERAQYFKFSDAPNARPDFIIQTTRVVIAQYIQYSTGEL